jgi:hypothetical protein
MSKFQDRLERISLGAPAPMGFGVPRAQKTPGMALVGLVSGDYAAGLRAVSKLAPDAALISIADGSPPLSEIGSSLGEAIPWGLCVTSLTQEEAQTYEDGGSDLLAFSLEGTPASALASEGMARVLCIEPSIQIEQLRAVNSLPVDVVFLSMTGVSAPWTLADLATIAGVSQRIDKYLLVEVSQLPGAKELEAIREVGVQGLVVDVGAAAAKSLADLKAALLDMPRQRPATKGRAAAILPNSVFFPEPAAGHEEEQPEEDE